MLSLEWLIVVVSTLPCPGHSTRIQADPGRSKWNGRNLVGIQVNSNLIPSKNNLIIQTQIFIHSRSFQVIPGGIQVFQVIPGGIQVKKRMIILATFQVHSHHIPAHSRSIPATFQVHSHHIPGSFPPYSRSIPGPFPPYSSTLPSLLGYEYYILLSTTTVYSIKKELKYRYKKEGADRKAMGARLSGTRDASGIVWAHSDHCHPPKNKIYLKKTYLGPKRRVWRCLGPFSSSPPSEPSSSCQNID